MLYFQHNNNGFLKDDPQIKNKLYDVILINNEYDLVSSDQQHNLVST